jgi:sulfate adenylyltransferase
VNLGSYFDEGGFDDFDPRLGTWDDLDGVDEVDGLGFTTYSLIMTSHLVSPYGGALCELIVDNERRRELDDQLHDLVSWDLSLRQLCDLELLLFGGFSPLSGFMTRAEYDSVCSKMQLTDGRFWPLPVTLSIAQKTAEQLSAGSQLVLRDLEGVALAVLNVSDIWQPDRKIEAQACFGTDNPQHPGVEILADEPPVCVGGRVAGLRLPTHYDFSSLRLKPCEVRSRFAKRGFQKVVAYQTAEAMHRAEQAMTFQASRDQQANLFIQPLISEASPDNLDYYARVRCYQMLLPHYPRNTVELSLLPLATRFGGAREAVLRAIVARNFGCTHLIIDSKPDKEGRVVFDPAQDADLALAKVAELGVSLLPCSQWVYDEDSDAYSPEDQLPAGAQVRRLSPAGLRQRLQTGRKIPDWYSYPEVIAELAKANPPCSQQGFTLFFSGLSGAGKSTLANVVMVRLMELGTRPVTLLDGDIVRRNLSSELGFSKEHRDINIRRIGFVAAEIAKNGGIAICAPIAPYHKVRKEVRRMVEAGGGFVLVHVATPLSECEKRDRKGIYKKARAGIITEFTGISDPYEEPLDAEVVIDTSDQTPDEGAQQIMLYLEKAGYIG